MSPTEHCDTCGAALGKGDLGRLCPACLLNLGTTRGSGSLDVIESNAGRSDADLQPGEIFGNYEILERIGAGGMGVVFKARQRDLQRLVALKLIRTGALATASEIRRFHREATMAGSLQHPNIVQIHEVGEWTGRHFFSMEYVEGRSLADLLREHPLPPKKAALYVEIVARAAHAAHRQGVVHRDLKPDNILIDRLDRPRLTDFGVARPITSDDCATLPGAILGTPSYMAPEQARGHSAQVGPTSDIYSLGAVLYESLTGRPPFRADSILETLRQAASEEPVSPRGLNRSVPRDLETLCLKCLAKDPASRYGSAEELADDLRRFREGEPIRARPVGAVERAWRWSRRNPSTAVTGVIAFALLLLLAVTGLRGHFLAIEELQEDARDWTARFEGRLGELGERVRELGSSQNLLAAVGDRNRAALTNILEAALRAERSDRNGGSFENWVVMDPTGYTLARVPRPTTVFTNREGRDYFLGALRQASAGGGVHFSKAYISVEDDRFKFGVSVPLMRGDGQCIGVLTGMANTESPERTLGFAASQRRLAVIAEGDTNLVRNPDTPNRTPPLLVFWHHTFKTGDPGIAADHPKIRRLLATDAAQKRADLELFYRDPMRHSVPEYRGFWLAAMVRAQGTPFVVIAQRRNPLPEVAFAMVGVASLGILALGAIRSRRPSFPTIGPGE